jgi:hypothetical protein
MEMKLKGIIKIDLDINQIQFQLSFDQTKIFPSNEYTEDLMKRVLSDNEKEANELNPASDNFSNPENKNLG